MRHGKPRNFVQPCLLLLLLEHPDHGYALVERLDSFLLAEGDAGAVYRSLHALEVSGAVRSTWGLSESGPARRTYHLTKIGREQLEEWAQSISDTREALETYLRRYAGAGTSPARSADPLPPTVAPENQQTESR
jgi:poly-beta-hydroxybutyrate-responsive repressor